MKQYLDLLKEIYEHGQEKHPSRKESGKTNNPTIGLPNLHFSHNMSQGFPLLTTRKLAWKGLVGELRGFLSGFTSTQQFETIGCKFWKPWARKDGSLGPIYGYQWCQHEQLGHVLECLRKRPTDRRMVVSAWRPDEHKKMVLPPCHVMWIVTPYAGKLNLAWFQRSCDFPIGVPYNIASYALLLSILSKWASMEPGNLDCIFCDAHIYKNQIPGVKDQLNRIPGKLPTIDVWFNNPNIFDTWQVKLNDWNALPNIDFGELEV